MVRPSHIRTDFQIGGLKTSTRNALAFVNTTAIAYQRKINLSLKILLVRNSGCVHKR